jgi:hypothetical protein
LPSPICSIATKFSGSVGEKCIGLRHQDYAQVPSGV